MPPPPLFTTTTVTGGGPDARGEGGPLARVENSVADGERHGSAKRRRTPPPRSPRRRCRSRRGRRHGRPRAGGGDSDDPAATAPFSLEKIPAKASASRMGIELPRNNPSEGGRRSVTANATPISVIPRPPRSASAAAASRRRRVARAKRLAERARRVPFGSRCAPSRLRATRQRRRGGGRVRRHVERHAVSRIRAAILRRDGGPRGAVVPRRLEHRLHAFDVTRVYLDDDGGTKIPHPGDTSIRSAQSTTCGHPADAGDQDEDAVDEDAVDEDAVALPAAARPRTRTPDAASATAAHPSVRRWPRRRRVRRVAPARDDENPSPRGSNQRGEFAEDAVARGRSVAVDERATRVAVELRRRVRRSRRRRRRDGALHLGPAQSRAGSLRRDRAEWISKLTVDVYRSRSVSVEVAQRGGGGGGVHAPGAPSRGGAGRASQTPKILVWSWFVGARVAEFRQSAVRSSSGAHDSCASTAAGE